MTFGEVQEGMKKGGRYTRPGWNNASLWCGLTTFLQFNGKPLSLPLNYVQFNGKQVATWTPTGEDTLMTDWTEAKQ